jgi:hypothetical protein
MKDLRPANLLAEMEVVKATIEALGVQVLANFRSKMLAGAA